MQPLIGSCIYKNTHLVFVSQMSCIMEGNYIKVMTGMIFSISLIYEN